ncbi:MAG: Lactaldehyde dehydrogenase [Methanocella sp. PtaU1.Bin125]|nr:MAG: Lactaldehyde dehydrogenase [Methanocella sp. PtaU1.Bin125]
MKMLINGRETDAASGRTFGVINPATEQTIDRAPLGDAEDVRAAIDAAEEAFGKWSAETARERGKLLFKAAQITRGRVKDLATLLTTEQGKPFREARDEVQGFANILEFYAGISASLRGGLVPVGRERYGVTMRKPIGICGAIIPWNVPAIIMGWKVGPALLTGNTLVVKPSTTAPLTCLSLAAIMQEAGLPAGVLNMVTGPGETVGDEIVRNPRIRKISFTGQTSSGKQIAQTAAASLKHVTLELGGSDPMIVCDDADLEAAAKGAVNGRFYNCGQACTSVKRLFVFERVADEYLKLLEQKVAALRIGNGMTEGVDAGPLNNRKQLDAIKTAVQTAREKGEGRIVAGGAQPEGPGFERGYFYLPTLVTDVPPESALMREEIFGPVLPVTVVKDLDEAIARANDTRYGLGSSVWTKNLERAMLACERLESGITWVNNHVRIPPEMPFGGVKDSGLGRENGLEAIDQYTEVKSILISP